MSAGETSIDLQVEQSIAAMLDQFRGNEWMVNEYWPLFQPHVRLVISDVCKNFPSAAGTRVLDLGCFNGYMSFLLRKLGYQVTGADGYVSPERDALFAQSDIDFKLLNLNELGPFNNLANESFHVVIFTQVIEHILNHPAGLIQNLGSLMRPGGLMILTTPNPATVMGAFRLLKGSSLLWGTREFINEPKIDGSRIISEADIHYREYTSDEVSEMITGAGLRVERKCFLAFGATRQQSALKRFLKSNPLSQRLMRWRPLASNQYFLIRKP